MTVTRDVCYKCVIRPFNWLTLQCGGETVQAISMYQSVADENVQQLEGGINCQILDVKGLNFPHTPFIGQKRINFTSWASSAFCNSLRSFLLWLSRDIFSSDKAVNCFSKSCVKNHGFQLKLTDETIYCRQQGHGQYFYLEASFSFRQLLLRDNDALFQCFFFLRCSLKFFS